MIIIPRLFNKFSKKDRPSWQEKYERRERLLMFTGPLFWTWNDLNIIGPVPPELIDHWATNPTYAPVAKAVSSFPYGVGAAAGAGGGGAAGPDVALSSISRNDDVFDTSQNGFRYETGGALSILIPLTSSWSDRTNEWVASGDKAAGLGDDYEAYADETTYTGGSHSGGWTDSTTYYTISSNLTLTCSVSFPGQTDRSSGNTSVREIANTSNVATTTFNIVLFYSDELPP